MIREAEGTHQGYRKKPLIKRCDYGRGRLLPGFLPFRDSFAMKFLDFPRKPVLVVFLKFAGYDARPLRSPRMRQTRFGCRDADSRTNRPCSFFQKVAGFGSFSAGMSRFDFLHTNHEALCVPL